MNGVPIERVLELGETYISADNRYSRLHRLTSHLSYAGFLEGSGVVDEDGHMRLLLRRPSGEVFEIDLRAMKLFSFGGLRWGRHLQLLESPQTSQAATSNSRAPMHGNAPRRRGQGTIEEAAP